MGGWGGLTPLVHCADLPSSTKNWDPGGRILIPPVQFWKRSSKSLVKGQRGAPKTELKQKNVVEISGPGQRGAPKTELEPKKVVEISDPRQRGASKTELQQKRSSKSLIPGKGVLQKLSWGKTKKRSCQIFVGFFLNFIFVGTETDSTIAGFKGHK